MGISILWILSHIRLKILIMNFFLILDRAQIHKKHEFLNKAEVKFYSFVADGQFSMPELDQLLSTQNPEELRPMIKTAAQSIIGKWEGVEIQNVKAGHIFEFGDTGRILFRSQEIPDSIDWIMFVVEIDDDIRNLGSRIDEILPDEDIDSLANNIITIASSAATPQATAAIAISKMLVRGITSFMKSNKNDQLGVIEQSFIRGLHYPNGKRTAAGVSDLTGNMWYDYTIFGIQ